MDDFATNQVVFVYLFARLLQFDVDPRQYQQAPPKSVVSQPFMGVSILRLSSAVICRLRFQGTDLVRCSTRWRIFVSDCAFRTRINDGYLK